MIESINIMNYQFFALVQYTFYFFKLEKDIDDPIVYEYIEGSKTPNKLNETLSEFMYKAASEYSKHFEKK